MSVRNLEFVLQPRCIALAGTSATPNSVGAVLARNLREFLGQLYFVNPKHSTLHGWPARPIP
jgi:acetyltransferase